MHIVEVMVSDHQFSAVLAQMRTWLDHMCYSPVAFRTGRQQQDMAMRVDFTSAAEAAAFARAFGGQVLRAVA